MSAPAPGAGGDRPDSLPAFYRLACRLAQAAGRILFGMTVGPVPPASRTGGCLFACNHKSYWDPPLGGSSIPRFVHFMAKEELFRFGPAARILRRLGALPIRRRRPSRRQMGRYLEILGSGGALLVFPEGTRIRRPGLGPPLSGVGFLARQAGVPVVPMYIGGTYPWWRALLRIRPVAVRFGEPLRFAGGTDGEIASRVMEAIGRLADPEDVTGASSGQEGD